MAPLPDARILGGIGAAVAAIGALIPVAGPFIALAGLLMVLLAVRQISEALADPPIYRNYLHYFALTVGGFLAFVAVLRVLMVSYLDGATGYGPGMMGGRYGMMGGGMMGGRSPMMGLNWGGPMVGAVLPAFAVLGALYIIAATFLKRSYDAIAARLDVGLFRTSARVYWVGAVLVPAFGLGLLLLLVAGILQIAAFLSIPGEAPVPPATSAVPAAAGK